MRARYAIVLAALGLLVSCRTTEPIGFIATPGYVEAQLAAREEALRADYGARIAELESELAEQRAVSEELASLAAVIRDVEASNRELQGLASQVEQEIRDLPTTTIEILVEVLTRHLEGAR